MREDVFYIQIVFRFIIGRNDLLQALNIFTFCCCISLGGVVYLLLNILCEGVLKFQCFLQLSMALGGKHLSFWEAQSAVLVPKFH